MSNCPECDVPLRANKCRCGWARPMPIAPILSPVERRGGPEVKIGSPEFQKGLDFLLKHAPRLYGTLVAQNPNWKLNRNN